MAIATPTVALPIQIQDNCKPNFANSMSQDYHHQGIFTFPNGFERAQDQEQQIRRDKLIRMQGFEPPPPQQPLVAMAVDQDETGGLPVFETAGMLSEMFNFPQGSSSTELLENQISPNYRSHRPPPPPERMGGDWYGGNGQVMGSPRESFTVHQRHPPPHPHHHHQQHQIPGINADSAAAMQLFLMNPPPSSSPPSPQPPPPHPPTSSTLHMLLPNPPSNFHHNPITDTSSPTGGGGHFGQFTWVPDSGGHEGGGGGGVVEGHGQGLSLSLSSSLQQLEAAKVEEELRLRDGSGSTLFFNQGGGGGGINTNSATHFAYKNLMGQNQHVHVGYGTSIGVVNVLRNSKYVKAAQELLEEFCSVGRGQFKKNKSFGRQNSNTNHNPSGGGGGSSSSKDPPSLSASDRIEHQRRKVKLLTMLDEVDRRYNHYCEQMQMVVNSFDLVMGFGSAIPYTALAQKAMSRHFRCLKDAIAAQLKHSCEVLGDKDAGTSGVTKGETPRLKLLEQSLRQQRAFHQMGMMEQEAWRPQRGLPERSVNILRAWLFEHFLHPYPSDADKHLLARQTGLSRNQVSNWFINARVRLWKPMVEDMYQQESKEEEATVAATEGDLDDEEEEERERSQEQRERSQNTAGLIAQTPTPAITAATAAAAGKGSKINVTESDPSRVAINNRQCFSENQANLQATATTTSATTISAMGGPLVGGGGDIGSALIRFGTAAASGDVSLTLGLRQPEKSHFSVRDFGAC